VGGRGTEDGHPRDARHGLLEQLQQFPTEGPRDWSGDPGDITAWPRQSFNEPSLNWIKHRQDNKRDGRRRFLGGADRWCTWRNDDINPALDELGREIGQLLISLRHAVLKDEVLSLNITKLMQCLPEYLDGARVTVQRTEQEKTDLGDFSRLLRLSGERCHEEAEGESDNEPDGAAPHGGVLQHIYTFVLTVDE